MIGDAMWWAVDMAACDRFQSASSAPCLCEEEKAVLLEVAKKSGTRPELQMMVIQPTSSRHIL